MTTKCDITVSKTATINTGNYSSIKPSVSITLHDIDSNSIEEKHKIMSELVDNLFTVEVVKLIDIDDDIKDRGIKSYAEILYKRFDDIYEDTKQLQERL